MRRDEELQLEVLTAAVDLAFLEQEARISTIKAGLYDAMMAFKEDHTEQEWELLLIVLRELNPYIV